MWYEKNAQNKKSGKQTVTVKKGLRFKVWKSPIDVNYE